MATTLAPEDPEDDITRILRRMAAGEHDAGNELAPLIYADLRKLANHYIRKERIGHTLQPTALVHEAYLRIIGIKIMDSQKPDSLCRGGCDPTRQILIDYAPAATPARKAT